MKICVLNKYVNIEIQTKKSYKNLFSLRNKTKLSQTCKSLFITNHLHLCVVLTPRSSNSINKPAKKYFKQRDRGNPLICSLKISKKSIQTFTVIPGL